MSQCPADVSGLLGVCVNPGAAIGALNPAQRTGVCTNGGSAIAVHAAIRSTTNPKPPTRAPHVTAQDRAQGHVQRLGNVHRGARASRRSARLKPAAALRDTRDALGASRHCKRRGSTRHQPPIEKISQAPTCPLNHTTAADTFDSHRHFSQPAAAAPPCSCHRNWRPMAWRAWRAWQLPRWESCRDFWRPSPPAGRRGPLRLPGGRST